MINASVKCSKSFHRTFYAMFLIFICLVNSAISQETVLVDAFRELEGITSLKCRIDRYQSMGGISIQSKGDLKYVKEKGFRYNFQFGGAHYRFILKDDTLCTVNLNRNIGFQVWRGDSVRFQSLYASVHVLGKYLSLGETGSGWKFRARVDDGYYFSRQTSSNPESDQFIRINPSTRKVDLIEEFENGVLARKVRLRYQPSKRVTAHALPTAVIVQGGSKGMGIDSLVISRVSINIQVTEKEFDLPDNITWQTMPIPTEAR